MLKHLAIKRKILSFGEPSLGLLKKVYSIKAYGRVFPEYTAIKRIIYMRLSI